MPPIVWVTNAWRATSAQPSPQEDLDDDAEAIFHRLRQSVPSTVKAAEGILADELAIHHVNRHSDILKSLEKLCATSHVVHQAVKKHQEAYRVRERRLGQLQELWGPDFIPRKYKPNSISNDLVRELLGLCKEVEDRTELARLWDDDGILPELMRNQPVSHKRRYITPKVVMLAREALKVKDKDNPKVTLRRKKPPQDRAYQPPTKRSKTYDPDASIEQMRNCNNDHPDFPYDDDPDELSPERLDVSSERINSINEPIPEQIQDESDVDDLQPFQLSYPPSQSPCSRQATPSRQSSQTPSRSQHSPAQHGNHSQSARDHSPEPAFQRSPDSPTQKGSADCDGGRDSEQLDGPACSSKDISCLSWNGSSDSRPTTDAAGAIKSLQPKCLLSATAIELVLARIFPADTEKAFRIVDPTYVDIHDISSIQQKPLLRVQEHHRHLIVLLHCGNNHWAFTDINLANQIILLYDSNASDRSESLIRTALLTFAAHQQPSLKRSSWTFQVAPCSQQNNAYDCGVLMLVNIIRLVLATFETPHPKRPVHCDVWRVLFESLLLDKAIDAAKMLPEVSSTPQSSEQQLTAEQIHSLEIAVEMDKDLMGKARMVVDGVTFAVNLLDPALGENEVTATLLRKRIATSEQELQQSDVLFEQLRVQCKTMFGEEELGSFHRNAERKMHQKLEQWRDKLTKYEQGAGSLRAAIATAGNIRDTHEQRCRQLEQDRQETIQTLLRFWTAKETLANRHVERLKGLLDSENTENS